MATFKFNKGHVALVNDYCQTNDIQSFAIISSRDGAILLPVVDETELLDSKYCAIAIGTDQDGGEFMNFLLQDGGVLSSTIKLTEALAKSRNHVMFESVKSNTSEKFNDVIVLPTTKGISHLFS
ncbi:hypothetical protein [Vibrio crassostreae]|uniref:hypothetical protein n=1 Tax=Vibrio crassostreae TaxID=246167 RepID=UPI001B3109BD|nr:hypothetical protein [Vibrio crassostreae]